MPYLVTDFPAADLVSGDTFVSADWNYAFVVVDPTQMGFTPDPDKVYAQSLVEGMVTILLKTQTVKKIRVYIYTFPE